MNRLLALVVMVLIAGLTPAAFATPPDQTWIGGWYDNGDFDDVVVLVTSTASAASTALTAHEPAAFHVVGVIVPPPRPAARPRLAVLADSRAPPAVASAR